MEQLIEAKFQIDLSPLDGLKQKDITKIVKKGVTAGSKLVKSAVKENAQSHPRTGNLAKSIGVKIRVYNGSAVGIVGPRSKFEKTLGVRKRGKHVGDSIRYRPSFIAHLVERGSKRSKANPFLQPAYDSTIGAFVEAVTNSIADSISKALK